jgi:hypothetical protein
LRIQEQETRLTLHEHDYDDDDDDDENNLSYETGRKLKVYYIMCSLEILARCSIITEVNLNK